MLLPAYALFAQTNHLQLEDTIYSNTTRWRDTCFGLINKTATNIPSGYLIDYSLAGFDSPGYGGSGSVDTLKDSGSFFSLHKMLSTSKVNNKGTMPGSTTAMTYKAASKLPAEKLSSIKQIKIYDASGKLRNQRNFDGELQQATMDVSSLSPGTYIVQVSDGRNHQAPKLIIQR